MSVCRPYRAWASTVSAVVCAAVRHGLRPSGLRSFVFVVGACALLAGAVSAEVTKPAAAAKAPAKSAAPAKAEEPLILKHDSVQGVITGKTKRNISVEFAGDDTGAQEMLLPFNDKTRTERFKSIAELERGDMIEVEFERAYRKPVEGEKEPVLVRTTAEVVRLVKQARQELGSGGQ